MFVILRRNKIVGGQWRSMPTMDVPLDVTERAAFVANLGIAPGNPFEYVAVEVPD